MARGLTIVAALFCLMFMAVGVRPAAAGARVALVIGNSAYKDTHLFLANPKNDADDVSVALKALGFDVITSTDLSLSGFEDALGQFKNSARGAEVALFFYAGHAVQFEHVNYFIPTDAVIDRVDRLKHAAISMDEIQDALSGAQGVQVLILDSCRDNPFSNLALASRSAAVSRGIERIQVGSGDSVILYSTRANEVALDGVGTRNSPFSRVLVDTLKQPGRHELGSLLRQVAARVKSDTGGKQSPELTMSISGDYYLDLSNDRLEWDTIKDSLDARVFRDFIGRFPDSTFRRDAERRVQVYEEQATQRRNEEDAAKRREEQRLAADRDLRDRQEAERQRQEDEKRRREDEARLKAVCSIGNQYLDILVTGRDRSGLERLSRENACPALNEPIAQALKSVIELNRQVKCARADDDLRRFSQSSNRSGLTDLRAVAECPGLPDKVAHALADLDAAEREQQALAEKERTCVADEARLATLRDTKRVSEVEALGKSSGCDAVRTEAVALARDLRDQEVAAAKQARQAAACSTEQKRVQALIVQGPRSAIEEIGRAHECETLDVGQALAQFDDLVAKRREQAAAACAAVDVRPQQEAGDVKGLGELAARCPSRKGDVDGALASIAAARHLAEACQRENAELQGDIAARRPTGVSDLQKRAECPTLDFSDASRQIAKAACDVSLSAVQRVGAGDEAALRGYATGADACDAARKIAASRLDTLLATRSKEDADCDAAAAAAVKHGDAAQLQLLPKSAICIRRQSQIAQLLESLRSAEQAKVVKARCDAAVKSVAGIGAGDDLAIRNVVSDAAVCEEARVAARDRLNVLTAKRGQEDQQCDAAVADLAGREDIGQLGQLSNSSNCVRRRDVIAARINGLRLAEQVRTTSAQRKLADLGCYAGKPNGSFDDATKIAVASYRRAKHEDGVAPTRISDDFVTELAAQSGPVCVVASLEPSANPVNEVVPKTIVPTPPAAEAPAAPAVQSGRPAPHHPKATSEPEDQPVPGKRRPRIKEVAEPAPRRVRPMMVREPKAYVSTSPRAVPRAAPPIVATPSEPASKPHIFY